ncbi:hypothetical protein KR018_009040, partial [Drosophila ironensis]
QQGISQVLCLLLATFALASCRSVVRRDVSHLPLEYLPPVVLPPVPSRDYLPPVEQHAASLNHVLQPPRDYLPPKLNNEYLPPVVAEEQPEEEVTTEAVEETTTLAPTTEVVVITTTEAEPEPETVTEQKEEVKTLEHLEVAPEEEKEVESAVLLDDGYHYRTPSVVPNLLPVKEYLPPLDNNAVVEEVPNNEEDSSALLEDGYHYRSVKRLRF